MDMHNGNVAHDYVDDERMNSCSRLENRQYPIKESREVDLDDSAPLNKTLNVPVSESVDGKTPASQNEDEESQPFARATKIFTLVATWTFTTLILLFLGFIVFGILYSGIHYHGEGWHDVPSEGDKCDTPFGAILGVSSGVFGYSNCNGKYIGDNTTESGLKWQCVEYARRYWMLRGTPVPATFASVVGAADIWDLETVQLLDSTTTPLLKYANGLAARVGGSAPRVGDLLVYPRQSGGFPFGHVAVIVGVKSESVLVAEQNWDNTVWPAPHHNYSREIPMQLDAAKNSYTIKEKDGVIVEGWVRYSA